MNNSRTLLLAAFASIAMPATAAANSVYDLLIFACDNIACTRIVEQAVPSGLAQAAEYNRSGLRLMMETQTRRTDEEDTRISLDVRSAEESVAASRPIPASAMRRLETFVVTLKHGAFRQLTSFVSYGTTYQVWARLAAIR